MARHQDGAALPGEVAQERAQPRDALGVEAVGGLVEHEDARVAEERGRELQALPHAHAEAADGPRGGLAQADEGQRLVGATLVDTSARASTRRWLRALRPGWNPVASSAAPTVRAGVGMWS